MARNLITDIPGIRVGHAGDAKLGSGVTAVIFDRPVTASVDVRGGGPGTRETALLDPAQTVEGIDAIVLSGGSAFGLDAASGTQAWLREKGRGFQVREARVPIVPAAILFDLAVGRRQELGSLPSLPRTRLRSGEDRRRRLRVGQCRCWAGRDDRQSQGWHWLGQRADTQRAYCRRACSRQCRRQHDHRQQPALLGGPF